MIKTKYRKIKTEIPHPDTERMLTSLKKYEVNSMHNCLPIIWDKADNASVWDVFGNKYIDFTASIFVMNAGHCTVTKDIQEQASKLIHSYTFPNMPRILLIEKLHRILPRFCEKMYLASAGSEVTSWATQLMRAKNPERQIVISFSGAFHGKVGEATQHNNEYILPFPTCEAEWDKVETDLKKIAHLCCGTLIESYQGWSARFMPKEYVQKYVRFCTDNCITVCFDEIQGGFWRTGKMFAYEHYEVEPDLLCLGKAIGGGLPVSVLTGREGVFLNAQHMSSTHSANPLCCAAAYSAIEHMLQISSVELKKKEEIFRKELNLIKDSYPEEILEICGCGMLWSLICANKTIADMICYEAMKDGLILVKTGKNSVKIGPPLTIPTEALTEGLCVLNDTIKLVRSYKD